MEESGETCLCLGGSPRSPSPLADAASAANGFVRFRAVFRCLAGKACAWGLVQASLLVWLRSVGRLVLVEVDGASVVVENFGVLPSNFSASHPRSSLVDTTCRPISPLHLPVTPLILYPLSRVHLSNAQNFASVNSTAYCLGLRLSSLLLRRDAPGSSSSIPWVEDPFHRCLTACLPSKHSTEHDSTLSSCAAYGQISSATGISWISAFHRANTADPPFME